MFLVDKTFTDLQDNNHLYGVGDKYPRKGYEPTPERVAELASRNNKRGEILIREVKAPKAEEKPKKAGGKKASE